MASRRSKILAGISFVVVVVVIAIVVSSKGETVNEPTTPTTTTLDETKLLQGIVDSMKLTLLAALQKYYNAIEVYKQYAKFVVTTETTLLQNIEEAKAELRTAVSNLQKTLNNSSVSTENTKFLQDLIFQVKLLTTTTLSSSNADTISKQVKDISSYVDTLTISSQNIPKSTKTTKCPSDYLTTSNETCIKPGKTMNLKTHGLARCLTQDYKNVDAQCVGSVKDNIPIATTCPTNYYLSNGKCVRPAGLVPNTNFKLATCPAGYDNDGTKCFKPADSYRNANYREADCPPGYYNLQGRCEISQVFMTPENRLADCPADYINTGTECKAVKALVTNLPREPDCPANYYKNPNGDKSCIRDSTYVLNNLTTDPICPSPSAYDAYYKNATVALNKEKTACVQTYLKGNSNVVKASCPTGYDRDEINMKCVSNWATSTDPISASVFVQCDPGSTVDNIDNVTHTLVCKTPASRKISCPSTNRYIYLEPNMSSDGSFYLSCANRLTSPSSSQYAKYTIDTTKEEMDPTYFVGDGNTPGYVTIKSKNVTTNTHNVPSSIINFTEAMVNLERTGAIYNGMSCPDGYIYENRACIKPSDSKLWSDKPSPLICPTDKPNLYAGMCYGNTCTDPEYNQITDNKIYCLKNITLDGGLDITTCKDGYSRIGNTCYGTCTNGTINDGINCRTDYTPLKDKGLVCGVDEILDGSNCYKKCSSNYDYIGDGICQIKQMTLDNKSMTCDSSTEFKYDTKCFKNCPSDRTRFNDSCIPKISTLDSTRMTCNKDSEIQDGAWCYAFCPSEYKNEGSFCRRPYMEYDNKKLTCNISGYPNLYQATCYKNCPSGSTNVTNKCYMTEDTLTSDYMICPSGYTKKDNSCYGPCQSNYKFVNDDVSKCTPINPINKLMECANPSDYLINGTCYEQCPTGYQKTSDNVCTEALDTINSFCDPDEIKLGMFCYGNSFTN